MQILIVIPLSAVFTPISTAELPPSKCGAYLSNYRTLQLKSLLHLGQNVITFRTLLHLGSFITFRAFYKRQLLWSFQMFLFCTVCCAVFYNYLRIFLLIWISFGPILSGFLKRFWRNQSHLNWNSILPTASSVTFMTLTLREKVLSQISKSDWWMV